MIEISHGKSHFKILLCGMWQQTF